MVVDGPLLASALVVAIILEQLCAVDMVESTEPFFFFKSKARALLPINPTWSGFWLRAAVKVRVSTPNGGAINSE